MFPQGLADRLRHQTRAVMDYYCIERIPVDLLTRRSAMNVKMLHRRISAERTCVLVDSIRVCSVLVVYDQNIITHRDQGPSCNFSQ
jgi:limonene-1,2-epoxide hydrolase